MKIPLKQGLKQQKTRYNLTNTSRRYENSIKTRIETDIPICMTGGDGDVVMKIPLKQGLKLCTGRINISDSPSRYENSIKTRIETESCQDICWKGGQVVMKIPLKQGLKLGFVLADKGHLKRSL